jgi:hypothetical protein
MPSTRTTTIQSPIHSTVIHYTFRSIVSGSAFRIERFKQASGIHDGIVARWTSQEGH